MKGDAAGSADPAASAVILAGGASTRMGRDKAWLELDGQPLIAHAVAKVRQLRIADVFISGVATADYSELKCPVLHDLEPGFGPLGGIERALHVCRTPLLLVLAVDLPGMTASFLRKLLARCDRLTGMVPKVGRGHEPLAAVYPKRCHAIAFEFIAKSRHGARDFASACLREGAVRSFPVARADAVCFANWNSPADLPGTVRTASS
jgi:molybdopterin-guanine dinucleotide biosynthesis protein A